MQRLQFFVAVKIFFNFFQLYTEKNEFQAIYIILTKNQVLVPSIKWKKM